MKKTCVSAFSALAVLCAIPAMAQTSSIGVQTEDLDLDSVEGEKELKRRIASAADDICGTERDRTLSIMMAYRLCRAQIVAEAQPQILALKTRKAQEKKLALGR